MGDNDFSIITRLHKSIHFYDANPSGFPTVLLLHGLGADGSSWGYQFPAIIKCGMHPVAPDLPGFGKSLYSGGKWRIQDVAKEITEFCTEQKMNPLFVVGISMGGTIAQQITLDYPEFVKKLVLVNTMASLRPKNIKDDYYLLKRFIVANIKGVEAQAELVARRIFPGDDQEVLRKELIDRIIRSDPKVYRAAMVSLGLFDVRMRLKEIKIPTLVISGANDTTVPLEIQQELVRNIPGAQQKIIPNSGHAAPVDQPDLFNQALVEFLAS